MKSNKKAFFASSIVLAFSIPVLADMFTPTPSCSKPIKPYEFTSQWELDSFNDDVQRYKQCIQEFIEEQAEAVKLINKQQMMLFMSGTDLFNTNLIEL